MKTPIVGDVVYARFKDGEWYPAEVVRASATGYRVAWFDEDRRSDLSASDIDELPAGLKEGPALGLGDRVLIYEDDAWCSGVIVGVFDVGYHVDWDNGEAQTRILRAAAYEFTAELDAVRAGTVVLGQYCPGEWYPARIKTTFADGYEALWLEDGRSATLTRSQVARLPQGTQEDASGSQPLPQIFPAERESDLQQYIQARTESGQITVRAQLGQQYCPHCRTTHTVQWFADRTYRGQFYVCSNTAETGIVRRDDDGRELIQVTVHDLMTRFPALPSNPNSFLRRIFRSATVQVTGLPPFVTVTFGRSRD